MSCRLADYMDRRTDLRTSLLIDAAINAATSHDVFAAAEELLDQHTPPDVVIRVLTRPAKRRHYPESDTSGLPTGLARLVQEDVRPGHGSDSTKPARRRR